jgi:hypothetical protein
MTTPFLGTPLDVNTIALWRMDDPLVFPFSISDDTGLYKLNPSGAYIVGTGIIGNARGTDKDRNYTNGIAYSFPDPIFPLISSGNFTFQSWFRIDPSITWPATWPNYGGANRAGFVGFSTTYTYAGNNGIEAAFGLTSTGFFLDVNEGVYLEFGSWENVQPGTWHHLAVRCTATGILNMFVDFFLDGIKISSNLLMQRPAGAITFGNMHWYIGCETLNFNSFTGLLDEIKVSKVSRSDTEIWNDAHNPTIVYDMLSAPAQRGTNRLLQQYKDTSASGVKEVVGECSNEVQVCTDALGTFAPGFDVSTAIGVQLDLLGRIVGEPRNGRTDDQYRIWIQAKIRVNRSSGTIEDLIDIFSILTGDQAIVTVVEYYPAKITVKLNGVDIPYPSDLNAMLKLARKAGVGSNLEYSTFPPGAHGFVFSGGTGLGFPNASLTPGSGGKFAGVV